MSHHHRCRGCNRVEKLIYSRRELLHRLGGGIAGLAAIRALRVDPMRMLRAE